MAQSKYMTVGELKRMLENYDDELPVGGIGHFGEILEFEVEGVQDAHNSNWRDDLHKGKLPFKILEVNVQDAGPEPD